MKTNNTISENLITAFCLLFIPLIAAGIISLIWGIITGDINTDYLN